MCTATNKWLPSVMPKDQLNPVKKFKEDAIKPIKAVGDVFVKDAPPPPPPPVKLQAAKTPSTAPLARRRNGGAAMAGSGTMLSGSSGAAVGLGNLGANTLLGG